MPFQNTCPMNDSSLPSEWLGRDSKYIGSAPPVFLIDVVMPLYQDAKMTLSSLSCSWHTSMIQSRMKVSWTPKCCFLLVPWLLIPVSIQCQSPEDTLPLIASGCKTRTAWQRAWQAVSSDPKPDCQILSPHLTKGGTLNKLFQLLASISTTLK